MVNMEEEVNFIYMDLNKKIDVSRKHGERIIYFENGNIRFKFSMVRKRIERLSMIKIQK